MADSGWALYSQLKFRARGRLSSPSTPTDTHSHDKVLVSLSALFVRLHGRGHVVIRDKR